MGEHLQHNTPSLSLSPAPDREATERSGSELTRLNSDSYSSITVDRSKGLPSHYCLDAVHTDWTDEKHRLYIGSLEASFVKELHHFRRLCALSSQQKMCRKRTMSSVSSSKLMILQDASRLKVKSERNDHLLDSTADSPAIFEGPWIDHFASAGKQSSLKTPDFFEECANCTGARHLRNMTNPSGFTKSSQHFPTCCHDSVATTTEVSDQNFADNHQSELSGGMSITNRLKKSRAESSSNDQVVPFGRLSSERENQNAKLSSENPENFVPPKSDLCYQLRGS